MKYQKVYECGPMSNNPQFNIPMFDAGATVLRSWGLTVVSPAELDDPAFRELCLQCKTGSMDELRTLCDAAGLEPASWGDLLARDVKLITNDGIEAIVCLPGWENSRGAKLETFVARLNDIPLLVYPSLEEIDARQIDLAHGLDGGKYTLEFDTRQAQDKVFKPDVYDEDPFLLSSEHQKAIRGDVAGFPTDYASEETRVTDPSTGGQKGSKAERYDLMPWDQLDEVARLYAAGAHKYEDNNWRRGYKWSLSYSSLIRHARAFWGGEAIDPEMQQHHLASVVFHALALMYFEESHPEGDDRWTP